MQQAAEVGADPGVPPRRDPRFLGRFASTVQVAFAVALGAIASMRFEPGFVPRGVVLIAVFGVPAVVGFLGTARRRPALLVAASLTSFVGSFVAFSGVTLIFLVPSVLFAAGAVSLELGPRPARDGIIAALGRIVAAAAIVVLLVAGGAAALLITDSGCWSNGCSTGLMSPRGVGLAAALWTAALALAHLSSRRGSAARSGPGTAA